MSNDNSSSNSPMPSTPDFDFAYDPAMFPNPPSLPSSAHLFSFNWDVQDQQQQQQHPGSSAYPQLPPSSSSSAYSTPHLNTSPTQGVRISSRSASANYHTASSSTPTANRQSTQSPTIPAHPSTQHQHHQPRSASASSLTRTKPLLSTPQKRLNHIMSEQKRRNAIRDGYAQLIALLAPADGAPGIGMPTRGRPKGSGSRGKGRSKGKSGVLFRAVEYCQWLEEGRAALEEEVRRTEQAAGINQQ